MFHQMSLMECMYKYINLFVVLEPVHIILIVWLELRFYHKIYLCFTRLKSSFKKIMFIIMTLWISASHL